jgi:hypothetical protein
MDWLLQHKVWLLLTILGTALLLAMLPVFSQLTVFAARMLQRFPRTPAPAPPANLRSFPSGNTGSTDAAPEPAAEALPSGYKEIPSPAAIVAEVCSLQSPVRERVEESFRGARVRWKLRLAAISEEAGSVHSVRMCPNARSALYCGVYFSVNADEYAVLHSAQKDEIFVVEGTIENVEGVDIDLKDVGTIEKAA